MTLYDYTADDLLQMDITRANLILEACMRLSTTNEGSLTLTHAMWYLNSLRPY